MRTFLFLRDATAVGLIAVTLTAPAGTPLPVISGRTYITGSATVKVKGTFQFDPSFRSTSRRASAMAR